MIRILRVLNRLRCDAVIVDVDPQILAIARIDHKLDGGNILLQGLAYIRYLNSFPGFSLQVLCWLLRLNHYVMQLKAGLDLRLHDLFLGPLLTLLRC